MTLIAVLTAPGLDPVEALPLSADSGGVEIAVPWAHAPDLPEGSPVDLLLEGHTAAFRAQAVLISQRPVDDALELRLAWTEPERVHLRMPGAVSEALAAHTQAYANPVRAGLVAPSRPGDSPRGRLLDLTPADLTLALSEHHAPAPGARCTLRLELPDGGPPAQTPVRVRATRALHAEERAVTLSFDAPDAPRQRLADRLVAYLGGRRSRVGSTGAR